MRLSLIMAVAALLGTASAVAANSPEEASGATAHRGNAPIQAQYYYNPYYVPYRYPYYDRYFRCEEDLGYGRRGNWGCG